MLRVTDRIQIDESELQEQFIRASGPGGQNVNKVATAVELRFDAQTSPSLTNAVRARLKRLAGSRMTKEGVLIIRAERFRSQEQNRADARARLLALLRRAAISPKPRLKTKPTPASRERRLQAKIHRGRIKQARQGKSPID